MEKNSEFSKGEQFNQKFWKFQENQMELKFSVRNFRKLG